MREIDLRGGFNLLLKWSIDIKESIRIIREWNLIDWIEN